MSRGPQSHARLESEPPTRSGGPTSYWSATRRPLPSLLFVTPLILVYEGSVSRQDPAAAAIVRTGADAWMRHFLASLGLTDRWLVPLVLIVILLVWQVVQPGQGKFRPSILVGMVFESVFLALALVGLSRLIDLGLGILDRRELVLLAVASPPPRSGISPLIGYLGAGVYEEALFRLLLVPAFFGILRLLQAPQVLASALAVSGSALLFSLAHHAGTPGESFTWFAFVFRWMAGVFFAWVFVIRGFGIAVGTHTAYDILVGWVGWSP